jgi:hypothetical protein
MGMQFRYDDQKASEMQVLIGEDILNKCTS